MLKRRYVIKDEFDYEYGRFWTSERARSRAWWFNTQAFFILGTSALYHVEDARNGSVVWRDTYI